MLTVELCLAIKFFQSIIDGRSPLGELVPCSPVREGKRLYVEVLKSDLFAPRGQ